MITETFETSIPVSLVPTPTNEYRKNRKFKKSIEANGKPITLAPLQPSSLFTGSRVLIYKQDPTVDEIGIRKAYIPNFLTNGPQDARLQSFGLPTVAKNAFGDFIQTPGTDAFDAVQTFAIVRMTLTMAQRALGQPIPWQWNSAGNLDPIKIHAHGLQDTMNAYYSRDEKSLKFGDFISPGSNPAKRVFTCRSLDIVSHETGHAILDALQPNWIKSTAPQTGGLHESLGDLTSIFLTLSQFDQVEAIIAQTKSNLHDKTFLSDLAEEFGLALGRPSGLRNADNDLKLSDAGTEVHAISQVFTGGIYDTLADIFAFEKNTLRVDDAETLYNVAQYIYGLLLRAIIKAPADKANFLDVINEMISISTSDGKPVQYRDFLRNNFSIRNVISSATAFKEGTPLKKTKEISYNTENIGDRITCCGTMKFEEYNDIDNYTREGFNY